MRRLKATLLLVPLALAAPAMAATFSTEAGPSVRIAAAAGDRDGLQAVAVSARAGASWAFQEIFFGGWSESELIAYSLGARTRGPVFALASIGGGYLTETTERLGTHGQFLITAGIGAEVGRYTLRLLARHISNGAQIFHHEGWPNLGKDVATLSVGVRF